jgi:hypothetical protein
MSAGNNDGDAVCEAYDYRTRYELNRRTQTCCTQVSDKSKAALQKPNLCIRCQSAS